MVSNLLLILNIILGLAAGGAWLYHAVRYTYRPKRVVCLVLGAWSLYCGVYYMGIALGWYTVAETSAQWLRPAITAILGLVLAMAIMDE